MNISISARGKLFYIHENDSIFHSSSSIEEIISELENMMQKYPYHKIWLSCQNIPAGIQEELETRVRKHNHRIDSDIDR